MPLVRGLLALALALCCLGGPARAQSPSGGQATDRVPRAGQENPEPADAPRLREELESLRLETAALAAESRDPSEQPRLEASRRAASRLESLIRQRLETLTLPKAVVRSPAVSVALSDGPPYPARELDLLRDQLDSLVAQRSALRLLAAKVSRELELALEAQRRAAEALRLRREAAERARGGPDAGAERNALRVARLESRVAELELARADEARVSVAQRLAALAPPIESLERTLETARPHQTIGPEDLAAVGERVDAERAWVARQRQAASTLIDRLESDARRARGGPEPAVTALRDTLVVLAELDAVESGRVDVWLQRRAALAAQDGPSRRVQIASLEQSRAQIRTHERSVSERLRIVRSEERIQEARIVTADQPLAQDRDAKQRLVDALKQRVEVEERLSSTLQAYDVLLERTLSDLAAFVRTEPRAGFFAAVGERLAAIATRLWRYELFNAVETTVVEGRSVDVAYGVTVGKVLTVLSLSVLGWWLAGWGATRVLRAMVSRGRVTGQTARVLRGWVMSVLLAVIVLVVLAFARVPLTAFAFLGGAIAIGVGFGAQNLIKNLICGVIILLERKIRVGDVVALDGTFGTVTAVDLRATTVRDFDGVHVLMPNSRLLEASVADWTYLDRKVRTSVVLLLAVDADVALASEVMLASARAHPDVLADPPIEVLFESAGPDGLGLRLQYWVVVGGPRGSPQIASDLRHAIVRGLRQAGVPLARARHEVLLDSVEPLDSRA